MNLLVEVSVRKPVFKGNMKTNFLDLPTDMIYEIAGHLDNESKVCLKMTTKRAIAIKTNTPNWNEFISHYKLTNLLGRYKKYEHHICITMARSGFTQGIMHLLRSSSESKETFDDNKKDGYAYTVKRLISNRTIPSYDHLATTLSIVREHFDTFEWLVNNLFDCNIPMIITYSIEHGKINVLRYLDNKSKEENPILHASDVTLYPCNFKLIGENEYLEVALWCVEKAKKTRAYSPAIRMVIREVEAGANSKGNHKFIEEFKKAREGII